MNPTTQLKNSLISRIKDSEDLDFLKALQTIFDTSEKGLYKLSPEQENFIEKGREEIRGGDFHKNKQVISETREWLQKK